jgi:hypothetical protein
LNNQLIECLHDHLDRPILGLDQDEFTQGVSMRSDCGEEVAYCPFSGEHIFETKALGVVSIAGFLDVAQGLSTVPAVDNLPVEQQVNGDRVEGNLATGRSPAQQIG